MHYPYPPDYVPALLPGPNDTRRNGIYCGDCLDLMRRIPDNSVNIILTSPPYNVGLKYDGFEDKLTDKEHKAFTAEWLKEAYRVTADTGRMYVIVSDRMLWWLKGKAEKAGWTFVQLLTWCKPNFVGSAQRLKEDWNFMTEQILLFRKGTRTPMLKALGATTHSYFEETVPQSNFKEGRIHPAQLPLPLREKILSRTPGDLVLDPFAGSASVCLAAQNLGRQYIGIDIVESVVERARARLNTANPPLFVLEPQQTALDLPGITA